MGLPHSIKTGKISSTFAIIKIILAWTPSGTNLQSHMAKVHVMELGEQLKHWQERQSLQNPYEQANYDTKTTL
jgi:hypothetical protein